MDKPLISIVANFYKSERYIPKLLKSVFAQTYTNWELICIDDCSPGNDFKLIQKLTNRGGYSKQVKIIRNSSNLGIAKAKKVGIDNASGKYITFIDGDDWFDTQALEKLYKPAIKYDLDLVIMNNYRVIPYFKYKFENRAYIPKDKYNIPIMQPELFDEYYIHFFGCNILPNTAYWGKLYKLKTIKESNIKYPNNDTYEDVIFNYRLFPHLKSMMFIDYSGYYWRWGGITSGKKNNIYSEFRFIKIIEEFYLERKHSIEKYNYTKAYKYLLLELKNVLKSMLSNIAIFDSNDKRSAPIIDEINKIIKRHPYYDIKLLYKLHPSSKNDEFINSIVNNDAIRIYTLCHNYYRNGKGKRLFKLVLHKLIYPLAKI